MPRRRVKSNQNTFDPAKSIRRSERTCTRKKRYETQEQAEFEADIRFIDYYECPFCKGYHLTSKAKSNG